jgi:hypothetical protein
MRSFVGVGFAKVVISVATTYAVFISDGRVTVSN